MTIMLRCERCGREVDARDAWRETVGWYRPRLQGGPNRVARRRDTGRYLCDGCFVLAAKGVPADHPTLLF